MIRRPPLLDTFDLPTRERLLAIEPGHFVQLIFETLEDEMPERMWVEIINRDGGNYWIGRLDSRPFALSGYHFNDLVTFHPLDIIAIFDPNNADGKRQIDGTYYFQKMS